MLEAKKKEASRSASRVAFRAALDSQLLEKRLRENRDLSVPDSPLPYVSTSTLYRVFLLMFVVLSYAVAVCFLT